MDLPKCLVPGRKVYRLGFWGLWIPAGRLRHQAGLGLRIQGLGFKGLGFRV